MRRLSFAVLLPVVLSFLVSIRVAYGATSLSEDPYIREDVSDSAIIKRSFFDSSVYAGYLTSPAKSFDNIRKIVFTTSQLHVTPSSNTHLHITDSPWDQESIFPIQWWDKILAAAQKLQAVTEKVLKQELEKYHVAHKMDELRSIVDNLLSKVKEMSDEVEKAAAKHGITPEHLSDEISLTLGKLLDELKVEFPPADEAPNHEQRKEIVSRVFDRAANEIIKICVKYGMSETDIKAHLDALKPHIVGLIVFVGDMVEEHPVLFEILIISGTVMLLPEGIIFRPLLRLFGFGPYGPIKGTIAPWCQRVFYGAFVTRGSWFSIMQRAGMKFALRWWEKIAIGIGAGIGVGAGTACR